MQSDGCAGHACGVHVMAIAPAFDVALLHVGFDFLKRYFFGMDVAENVMVANLLRQGSKV